MFTELQNGFFPPRRVFLGNYQDAAKAITLNSLVKMKKAGDVSEFLLGDESDVTLSQARKRSIVIDENLDGILQNLRDLALKYAIEIISGDMSIFSSVMKYKEST